MSSISNFQNGQYNKQPNKLPVLSANEKRLAISYTNAVYTSAWLMSKEVAKADMKSNQYIGQQAMAANTAQEAVSTGFQDPIPTQNTAVQSSSVIQADFSRNITDPAELARQRIIAIHNQTIQDQTEAA